MAGRRLPALAEAVVGLRAGEPSRQKLLRRVEAVMHREQQAENAPLPALVEPGEPDRLAAELDVELGQGLAFLEREAGDGVGDPRPRHRAQMLDQLVDQAARAGRKIGGGGGEERLQAMAQHALQPSLQALLDGPALAAVDQVVLQQLQARAQRRVAGGEPGDRRVAPGDPPVGQQAEGIVAVLGKRRDAFGDRRAEGAPRRRQQRPGLLGAGIRRRLEAQALQPADDMAFDQDLVAVGDAAHQRAAVAQPAMQGGMAAIDEALGQGLVQGVGEPVLDRLGPGLPVLRVRHPVAAIGDIGPGADMRDAAGQLVDVALDAIQAIDLFGDPVVRQVSPGQMLEQLGQQLGMGVGHQLAEIRHLADLPEQHHPVAAVGQGDDLGVAREMAERQLVLALLLADEAGDRRPALEAVEQALDAAEIEIGAAPHQVGQRIEAVVLHRLDDLRIHRPGIGRGAEGAVGHMAPGAAGDLADLGLGQRTRRAAVELAQAGEGDVMDVHVEAHADGVGRHQVVDLARLVEFDLGVAGARAERPHDDGRAAALAADQLGDAVDLGRREGDDGRAWWQAGDLPRPRIGQGREARPLDEFGIGYQGADPALAGVGAHHHGLAQAAGPEQTVGEDVAALGIGGELDLVHRQKADGAVERHGFDGADEVARRPGDDLLLAGDQRHRLDALRLDHPVVVLARQQPERKADHAAGMTQHAFHGEMRLAGIGRPQNGREP